MVVQFLDKNTLEQRSLGSLTEGVCGRALPAARRARPGQDHAAFDEYFDASWGRLLLVAQIETVWGVAAAAGIAAVEGVDVLFVGPTDLGCSLAGGKPLAPLARWRSATRRQPGH